MSCCIFSILRIISSLSKLEGFNFTIFFACAKRHYHQLSRFENSRFQHEQILQGNLGTKRILGSNLEFLLEEQSKNIFGNNGDFGNFSREQGNRDPLGGLTMLYSKPDFHITVTCLRLPAIVLGIVPNLLLLLCLQSKEVVPGMISRGAQGDGAPLLKYFINLGG